MNTIRSNCSQMAAGVGGRLNFAESDVEFLKDQGDNDVNTTC